MKQTWLGVMDPRARSHFGPTGKAKIAYNNQKEAGLAKPSKSYRVYLCAFCDKYHIGKKRKGKSYNYDLDMYN